MSKASSQTPLELVDRYLQAVRFWLPRGKRDEELLAELGEDLRSQIEAREEQIGHPAEVADISAILRTCGSPMVVAARLGPQRSLIGPGLFPIYRFILKMVLLWVLLPLFLFIVGPVHLANSGGNWPEAVLQTLAGLWNGGFVAAGTITLVFALLERTHALAGTQCRWDPESLPPLQRQERKTSLVHTACDLFFNLFGLVWLLLIPGHPFMILGSAAAVLKPAPLWQGVYLPVVLLAAFATARSAVTLARPDWAWWPRATRVLHFAFVLVLVSVVLNAVPHGSAAERYPFVILAEPLRSSAPHLRIAAIVNLSILIALVAAWIGVGISLVIHAWELLRDLRRQMEDRQRPAPLPMH